MDFVLELVLVVKLVHFELVLLLMATLLQHQLPSP